MPLRPGSKIEYISKHLGLTNQELVEKAKADGISLTVPVIDATRWTLRTKYGFKNTGSSLMKDRGKKKKKQGKRKYTARASAEPKRRKKKDKKKDVSPERALKHAELRKLVFELGYDEVKDIFSEFQDMHNRWG